MCMRPGRNVGSLGPPRVAGVRRGECCHCVSLISSDANSGWPEVTELSDTQLALETRRIGLKNTSCVISGYGAGDLLSLLQPARENPLIKSTRGN